MGIFKQAGRLIELRKKSKEYRELDDKFKRAMSRGDVHAAGTYAEQLLLLRQEIVILRIDLGLG